MGGEVRRPVRTRGTRRHAQATLELACAAPLFLICLLGAVDAGLWAVQASAEVSALERAARVAASAGTSPASQTAPDAQAVTAEIVSDLRPALFATGVVAWCDPDPHGGCRPAATATCPTTSAQVEAAYGPRVVAVCVHEQDPPACGSPPRSGQAPPYCTDPPTITVRVIGFLASLVPPGFGPGAEGAELPTDMSATTHTLRFSP